MAGLSETLASFRGSRIGVAGVKKENGFEIAAIVGGLERGEHGSRRRDIGAWSEKQSDHQCGNHNGAIILDRSRRAVLSYSCDFA